MINTKESINEDQNTENHIAIQPKTATPLSKRKLLDVSLTATKHIKIVEEIIDERKICCALCNKTLKFINTFKCRCGKEFCSKHRFYDQHKCTFDYKSIVKEKLKSVNQKVAPRKFAE